VTDLHVLADQLTGLNDSTRDGHPVRLALREAGMKLACLMPHTIYGDPTMQDAKALQQDLDAIAAIVDPVVNAVGRYAQSNFGRIDMALFTDQLRDALDGNATFDIEQAARAWEEEREESG
jgi:hypothetical protein